MAEQLWILTVWWGGIDEFGVYALEAKDWNEAVKEVRRSAGLLQAPREYEVLSAIVVRPEGLDTEVVSAYFSAGQKPEIGEHVDDEDQAAAGLWRQKTPTGQLSQYVITGTVWEDDLRFTQDLNDTSLKNAIKTVEDFYATLGPSPRIRFYSAVELTPDGIVNVWWLRGKQPVLRYALPAPGGAMLSKKAVAAALAKINRYRNRTGQRPLDPITSGWTDEDVILEAQRLGSRANPIQAVKERMLSW